MSLVSEHLTKTKSKIVATVGPASESTERLTELLYAGVDAFRLNMAHGSHEWHAAVIDRIRDASSRAGRPVAILADLGGPKIRLGPITGGKIKCEPGGVFRFVRTPSATEAANNLTSTYATLVQELNVGDSVLLADGTVSMQVVEKQPDAAVCRVVQGGEIRSGGGINLPGVELQVPALTDKDRDDLRWAAPRGIDFFGLSFVRRAADVRELRQELTRLGCSAQIVAKIEKPQAVDALDEILRESDAVMVARGDLGVEIDVARVATVQKEIIRRCHRARLPVITATQMLESMTTQRLPTRAEATDVANAVLDGTDALMLSAETAMGQYPVEAVSMMSRIAREAERLVQPRFGRGAEAQSEPGVSPVTESLVEATSRVADQLQAKLVVVATRTGRTARVLCKQRSQTPIVGISDDENTVRRLCLYWGVTPLHAPHFRDSSTLLHHVIDWARRQDMIAPGDRVVFIASTQWTAGGHDMIVVHQVT